MNILTSDIFYDDGYKDYLKSSKESMLKKGYKLDTFNRRSNAYHGEQIGFKTLFRKESMELDIEVRINFEIDIKLLSNKQLSKDFNLSVSNVLDISDGDTLEDRTLQFIEGVKIVSVERLVEWIQDNL